MITIMRAVCKTLGERSKYYTHNQACSLTTRCIYTDMHSSIYKERVTRYTVCPHLGFQDLHLIISTNKIYTHRTFRKFHFYPLKYDISPLIQYRTCIWPQDYIPTHNIVHKKVLLRWGKGTRGDLILYLSQVPAALKKCLFSSSLRIPFFMTLISFRGLGLNIIHGIASENLGCDIIKDTQLQC